MSDSHDPQDDLDIDELYQQLKTLANKTLPALLDNHRDNKEVIGITLGLHHELLEILGQAEDTLISALSEIGVKDTGEVIGQHFFEPYERWKKVYDNPRLAGVVAEKLAKKYTEPDDNGEVFSKDEAIAMAVEDALNLVGAKTASFNAWRVGVAKELQIRLSPYYEDQLSGSGIKIR